MTHYSKYRILHAMEAIKMGWLEDVSKDLLLYALEKVAHEEDSRDSHPLVKEDGEKHYLLESDDLLPIPRLELEWVDDKSCTEACRYHLVYRHYLGGILGVPLGYSRRITNMPRSDEELVYNDDALPQKPRISAMHDAQQLNLPLYVKRNGFSRRIS